MRFTHAVFDLDGTLIDTEPLYTAATQQILDPFGKQFSWELKQRMMGRPALESARVLVEALGIDLTPEAYLAQREPLVAKASSTAPEIAGAGAFVEQLSLRGLGLSIATSSDRELCEVKLSARTWRSRFTAVVCGDDPRVARPKPAPDIFLEAARQVNADPRRTLAFEDSPAGVAAAHAAGMTVIAIADPRMAPDKLPGATRIAPDFRALSLSELLVG